MLAAAGARVRIGERTVSVWPAERLELGEVEVPGDFSSAAPFVVAATLVPGSELHLHGINLNPRRTGLLSILERMGARITVYNRRRIGGEPAGDLEVRSAELVGTKVGGDEVPLAIDELPLFALAASSAHGDSRLRGAEELRAKETDRIEAVVDGLRALGAHVRGTPDGFVVRGVPTRLRGGRLSSQGDHRIAMLGAVAGLASREGVEIDDAPRWQSASPASSRCSRPCGARRPRDRRHRRAGRRRQEHRRPCARAAARLPLPGHRCHVPRAHLARARARHRARRRHGARDCRARPPRRVRLEDAVTIDGIDVTTAIREPRIDAAVPVVARHQEVREVMRERQRALGHGGDSVIEGRDIGVVVVPDAEVKVWLVADPAVRAERRAAERDGIDAETLAEALRRRDERDAANTHRAADAVEVDTTDLTLDEVVDRIATVVAGRGA